MAQPVQELYGTPGGEYCVIDNGAPGNGGVAGGIGYDNCANGANAQGKNVFKNGTVPDYVPLQTAVPAASVNESVTGITVSYKNPS